MAWACILYQSLCFRWWVIIWGLYLDCIIGDGLIGLAYAVVKFKGTPAADAEFGLVVSAAKQAMSSYFAATSAGVICLEIESS